jgi:hypothetical protein
VAADLLRVVVVSRVPVPVTTLLRSKLPECRPVSVPAVDDVAAKLRPEAIVLLDLGDPETNLNAARKLRADGIRHGILVIRTSASGGLPGVIGLDPPFTLTDFRVALERARQHSARATSAEGSERVLGSEDEAGGAPETPPPALTKPKSASAPPPPPRAASAEPGPTAQAALSRQDQEDIAASEVATHAAIEQPRASTPLRRGPSMAVPQVAREAVTAADESLLTGKAPSPSPGTASHGGSVVEPLRAKADRWRKRLSALTADEDSKPPEPELHERLVQIFAATSQIESIAADLPSVIDPPALFQAIVTTVADEFAADSVVLWRRARNGWVAAAHRGLTAREANMPVGFDQPVLHDVDAQTGAILLYPTARFQHLIVGIGGAHTESFMASSVAVGANRLGILAVGRDEPLVEADLDRFAEMAVEAAVGIGVADHIQRMASLVAQIGGQYSPVSDPGEWRKEFLDELHEAWHSRHHRDEAIDPAAAAGLWSARATRADVEASPTADPEETSADEPEVVIDLNRRSTKQG